MSIDLDRQNIKTVMAWLVGKSERQVIQPIEDICK